MDAHEQGVVLGVFTTVVHEVCGGFGHLYPLDASLYPQLLHRPPGVSQVVAAAAGHLGGHLG